MLKQRLERLRESYGEMGLCSPDRARNVVRYITFLHLDLRERKRLHTMDCLE